MLSISMPLSDPEYVLSMARLNYYTEGGEPLGQWFGGGAEALGLSGTVDQTVLRRLFQGRSADGSTDLVQNVGSKDRQCGWDLTFSAGKSISVVWAVADPLQKKAIEAAHDAAVKQALEFLQAEAVWTRRGKGSLYREQVHKLIFALFQHGTSRANDPQLHTHCLLLNLAVREDGTTGSILTKEVFRLKMIAGLIYRQELGRELAERLGFGLVREKTWLQIDGVPGELCDAFSKRRAEVLEHLDKMGKTDAASAAAAAKATRSAKEMTPRETLFAEWAEFARKNFGFTHESVRALHRPFSWTSITPILDEVLSRLLRQNSYFSDRQFLRSTLELTQATGLSVNHVLTSVRERLRTLVPLGIHEGRPLYTTREILDLEEKLFHLATRGRLSRVHQVAESKIPKSAKSLSPSQLDALKHAVCSRGDVAIIQGLAGTGKSSLLRVAAESWRNAGFRVLGAAYSGKAADGLGESAAIESHTVDRLLHQWAKSESAVKPLAKDSILVVDEAGMLDTQKLLSLVTITQRRGAKLVLVGDEKQLPPIAAGAPFAELGRVLGRADLTEIQRQKNVLLRLVVEQLAGGNMQKALRWLQHDRLLRLHDSREQAKDSLVLDWYKSDSVRQSIMLAATHEDVLDLNKRAQSMRAKGLKVLLPMFSMNGATFRIGDRILFGRNNRLLGVRNGTLGELKAFNPLSRMATIALDSGKTAYVPIDKYRHLNLGYCLTTHKAQGTTVDKTFVLWSDSMQSREMTYVQASRSRYTTQFYLTREQAGDDFEHALRQMERSVAKDVAISKQRNPDRDRDLKRDRGAELSPSL